MTFHKATTQYAVSEKFLRVIDTDIEFEFLLSITIDDGITSFSVCNENIPKCSLETTLLEENALPGVHFHLNTSIFINCKEGTVCLNFHRCQQSIGSM